ncbi:MAG TPA: sigma-70 family RNA polymerase sigma factor [Polyangiales bacterium]|nr:sigma-70 family RNA polymerase sigma factor [Polyangiales bacterium]
MSNGVREDEHLLNAVASGDREALGVLYDRHAPRMLALATRILGSPREAEDLVHDVFLEAWHRARQYDASRGSVRAWLILRTRSRSLDALRAARRAPRVELEAAGQRASDSIDPGDAHDGGRLRALLEDLPKDQHAVLQLAYFGGYSFSEIAERLSIPVGTVKSRMSRAIEALRNRLGASGEGDA